MTSYYSKGSKEGRQREGGKNIRLKEKPSQKRQLSQIQTCTLSRVCGHLPRDQGKPQCAGYLKTTITERRNQAYKYRNGSCFSHKFKQAYAEKATKLGQSDSESDRLLLLDVFCPFLLLALPQDLISDLVGLLFFHERQRENCPLPD